MGKDTERNFDQNSADEIKSELKDEADVLNKFMFFLDMRGIKSLVVIEKAGNLIAADSGISGIAKVHLIMDMYIKDRAFFEIAMQRIREIESGADNNRTVH